MNSRGDGRVFERKGSSFFWIAYYHHGKEQREVARHVRTGKKLDACEDNRSAAEKFLKHRLGEIAAEQFGGRAFVGPQQERLTVGDLLDALTKDYELRGKDTPQFKAHLKAIRERFGTWKAVQLTTEAVDKYISDAITGSDGQRAKAPATVNRGTQLLAQAYKLAIERRNISTAPVIRHLSEGGNARQGFFGDKEFRSVAANLPDYLRDFAMFAYLTGWRRGEVASLQWSDVDGDVIRLRAENAKNGEARSVILDGQLADLIERRKKAKTVKVEDGDNEHVVIASLVFHHDAQPIVDYRKAWATACVMAGVGRFVCPKCSEQVDAKRHCEKCDQIWKRDDLKYVGRIFHDLRRTAVRNMVRAGVPERVAMTISGHKTRSIFDRYNIVSERDLREAMQRTQAYLLNSQHKESRPMPKQVN